MQIGFTTPPPHPDQVCFENVHWGYIPTVATKAALVGSTGIKKDAEVPLGLKMERRCHKMNWRV